MCVETLIVVETEKPKIYTLEMKSKQELPNISFPAHKAHISFSYVTQICPLSPHAIASQDIITAVIGSVYL